VSRELNSKAFGKQRAIDTRLSNVQREVDRRLDAIVNGTRPSW
jgi:hypothetical protein